MEKIVEDMKRTLIGEIPLVSAKYAEYVNQHIKGKESKYKPTNEHIKDVLREFHREISELINEQDGGYMGDAVKFKIILEYDEENK